MRKGPEKEESHHRAEEAINRLKRQVRRRVLKIISIVTGISLGSFVLLIGITLGAITLFVRTQTFQNGLRDRIIQVTQQKFGAHITYDSAKLSLFRLEPQIEFINVHLQAPKSKTVAEIERVAVGISIVFSIPLLFFKQLHLSSAEIEGAHYHLTNLKEFQSLVDSARPRSYIIPSAFQTSIGNIHLKNVEIDVDYSQGSGMAEAVHGKMKIEDVLVDLGARDTGFKGLIHFSEIRNKSFGPFSGDLSIRDGSHNSRQTHLGQVRFQSDTEFLEISGDIKRWANPILDLQGKIYADVHHLFTNLPATNGKMSGNFALRGPWQNLEGEGSATSDSLEISGKKWDKVQGKFKLKYPDLDLSDLSASVASEKVEGSAKVSLAGGLNSQIELKIAHANLGSYLGILDEALSRWKGETNGAIKFQGGLFPLKGNFQWQLGVDDYTIRSFPKEAEILHFPKLITEGEGQIDGPKNGRFTTRTETGGSKWTGTSNWDADNFSLQWDANFPGSELGELFLNKLALQGTMRGSYKGPKSHLVMSVDNHMNYFSLNNYKLTNFQGKIALDNRTLFAAPITSDQLELNGGIKIIKGEHPDELANLQFKTKKISLEFLTSFIHSTKSLASGLMTSEGHLKGVTSRPVGSGRLQIDDWTWRGDKTKGRKATANFAVAEGEGYLDAVELRISSDSKPVQAELAFDGGGIVDMWAEGQGVRLSDWFYLLGIDFNIQGMTDFRLDYQRHIPSMKANMKIYKSSVAGISQADSNLKLDWMGDKINFSGDILGDKMKLSGAAAQNAKTRTATIDAKLANFDLFGLSEIPSLQRLQFPVQGSAHFNITQDRSENRESPLLVALVKSKSQKDGELKIQHASIDRGSLVIEELDPFSIKLQNQGLSRPARWSMDRIKIHSESNVLDMNGFFESPQNFLIKLQGQADLRAIATLVPVISRSEGTFQINGEVDPQGFTGKMDISDGVVALQNSPLVVRDMQASMKAVQSKIDVLDLKGQLKEGTIAGKGWIKLDGFNVGAANLNLQLENTLIQPQPSFSFRASGPISLKVQSPTDGEVAGKLTISEGVFRQRLDVKADLLKLLEPERREFKPLEDQEPAWRLWKLNVGVVTADPFEVRNNIAEGSAGIDLVVGGTIREPQLRGNVRVIKGEFTFNNHAFNIQSGSIQFQNQKSNIPTYDIRAQTDIDIYRVDIALAGGPDYQRIHYSSDPELTEKEILSLITFGITPQSEVPVTTATTTKTDNRLSAAYAGISFVTGQIQDKLEGRLSSEFGIHRFTLLPAFYDQTGTTELQLTVGTDLIRNRLALNYSNFLTVSGGHRVELDLTLSRLVHLVGSWRDVETESSGDFGGDLRFRFEFD